MATEPRSTYLRREIARLQELLQQPGLAPFVITANSELLSLYKSELLKEAGTTLSRSRRPEEHAFLAPDAGRRITPDMAHNYAQGVRDAMGRLQPRFIDEGLPPSLVRKPSHWTDEQANQTRTLRLWEAEYDLILKALEAVRRVGGFTIGLSMEESVDLDALREKIRRAHVMR